MILHKSQLCQSCEELCPRVISWLGILVMMDLQFLELSCCLLKETMRLMKRSCAVCSPLLANVLCHVQYTFVPTL